MRCLRFGAAVLAGVLLAGGAQAAWPERPVTVIVSFPAGGSTDVAARAVLPYIEKHLPGISFVVVNKPGAAGEIGSTEIALAKPDGYTIGFLNMPSILSRLYERKPRYTKESFTYIANLVYDPGMFGVQSEDEIKTLQDAIEFGKKNPGRLTGSTAGVGTDDHLLITRFQSVTGVQMTHIPTAGDVPATTALLGGHVKMAVLNAGGLAQWIQEGKMRGLAVASEKRIDILPDVPTFRELGVDIVSGSARGMGGPAGLPAEVVDKLSAAIKKAITDPEFIEASKRQHVVLHYLDSAGYRKLIDEMDVMVKAQWEQDPWVKK